MQFKVLSPEEGKEEEEQEKGSNDDNSNGYDLLKTYWGPSTVNGPLYMYSF